MQTNCSCTIILHRHGETAANKEGVLQGQRDVPLNEEGRKQAEGLKQALSCTDFSAAFTSDLSRASQTASIVLGGRQIAIVKTEALRERCMGQWEGKKSKELRDLLEGQGISFTRLTKEAFLSYKLAKEIESYNEVFIRLTSFIRSQVTSVASNAGKTVVLSAHGGLLRCVLHTLAHFEGFLWKVPNCSYITLQAYSDGIIQLVGIEGPEVAETHNTPW